MAEQNEGVEDDDDEGVMEISINALIGGLKPKTIRIPMDEG